MVCTVSCMISLVFVIGMIYFYKMTDKSTVVHKYKSTLTDPLKKRYEQITNERARISYQGYVLGVVLSMFIIYYNIQLKGTKIGTTSLVCTVVATAFLTNYFYYMTSPKTDWMLNHMHEEQEVKAWLAMYREMQYNYHMGLVLGIVAVGILGFAFRC